MTNDPFWSSFFGAVAQPNGNLTLNNGTQVQLSPSPSGITTLSPATVTGTLPSATPTGLSGSDAWHAGVTGIMCAIMPWNCVPTAGAQVPQISPGGQQQIIDGANALKLNVQGYLITGGVVLLAVVVIALGLWVVIKE